MSVLFYNLLANKSLSVLDVIDTIYVLNGLLPALDVVKAYYKISLSGYIDIKLRIDEYKDVYKEDPLLYSRTQVLAKVPFLSLEFYCLLVRIASIKFGDSLVKSMLTKRASLKTLCVKEQCVSYTYIVSNCVPANVIRACNNLKLC